MDALTTTGIKLKTTECCRCGCTFGMPEQFYDDRLNDHKDFYCPNGHAQHFVGKTEAESLRESLHAARVRRGVAMLKSQLEQHYRISRCAEISGLKESTWRKWVLLRKVSYVKVGGATCIPESELRRILERGRVPAREARPRKVN